MSPGGLMTYFLGQDIFFWGDIHMNDDLLNKAKQYRWYIFWILALGYVLVYFHRLCPAVVAVEMMKYLKNTLA